VPYVLLGVALLIALGFEFVNGFPRHGECRGDGDLHALARSKHCRGVVGLCNLAGYWFRAALWRSA